jgi:hypothetical protein
LPLVGWRFLLPLFIELTLRIRYIHGNGQKCQKTRSSTGCGARKQSTRLPALFAATVCRYGLSLFSAFIYADVTAIIGGKNV